MKLQPSDILDVNLGIQRQRNKVDVIKRKVSRTNRNTTKSYESINDVSRQIQKVICYEKRKGDWRIPTIPSLYMYISKMIKRGDISSAYSDDVTMKNGKVITLVAYGEVRRNLLNHRKFDLQDNREFGPMEPNPMKKGRKRKAASFWARLKRWIRMFNKEVL